MRDKSDSVSANTETKKPKLKGLIYFVIACILIAVPFIVYRVFILGPLQDMSGK